MSSAYLKNLSTFHNPTPCASGNSIEKSAADLFHPSRCQRVQLPAKHYHTFSKLPLAIKRVSNKIIVHASIFSLLKANAIVMRNTTEHILKMTEESGVVLIGKICCRWSRRVATGRSPPPPRGRGDCHMKGAKMLVVSLMGCKFRILVSLRVFWTKRHYI